MVQAVADPTTATERHARALLLGREGRVRQRSSFRFFLLVPFFPLSPLPAHVRYRQAATHPPGRPGQGARRQERRDALASLEVAFGDDVGFLQAHDADVAVLRLPQPSIQLIRLEGAVADVEGRDEEVHLCCGFEGSKECVMLVIPQALHAAHGLFSVR